MIILKKKKRARGKTGDEEKADGSKDGADINREHEDIDALIKALALRVCQKNSIPFVSSMVSKFKTIYEQHISKLECVNENILKIYIFAFVYRFTKSSARKSDFVDGRFSVKILGRAIKQLGEWSREDDDAKDVEHGDGDGRPVCNLYRIA